MPGMTVLTSGLLQDEAQRQLGHGHARRHQRLQRVGALHAGDQVLGHEVGVAPVALRPAAVLRQRAGQRALVERHAGDHARRSCSRHAREQLVLGRLVEDVVDHLHGVDQPACASVRSAFAGSQRLMLTPTPSHEPLALQVVDRPLPALVVGPGVLPDVELDQVDAPAGPGSRRLFSVYSRMWSGGKTSSSGVRRAATATCGSWAGSSSPYTAAGRDWPRTSSPEQLLAVPVAVAPGRVEEVAAQVDRALQRRRSDSSSSDAGPAGHAPHAVADLADLPAQPAKRAILHLQPFYAQPSGARAPGHRTSRTTSSVGRVTRTDPPLWVRNQADQRARRHAAHLFKRLAHRGQGRVHQPRLRDIVKPENG